MVGEWAVQQCCCARNDERKDCHHTAVRNLFVGAFLNKVTGQKENKEQGYVSRFYPDMFVEIYGRLWRGQGYFLEDIALMTECMKTLKERNFSLFKHSCEAILLLISTSWITLVRPWISS